MADYIKEAVVKISADVGGLSKGMKEAEARIASLEAKLKKTTATGNKMGGMFGDKVAKQLGSANEKTEKFRQITTALGGEMGSAAGTAVYYGGTLGFMVGKFGALEIAAMSTTAVIVVGGVALLNYLDGPVKEAIKLFDAMNKEMDKNIAKFDALIDRHYEDKLGMDKWALSSKEASHQLSIMGLELSKAEDKMMDAARARENFERMSRPGGIGSGRIPMIEGFLRIFGSEKEVGVAARLADANMGKLKDKVSEFGRIQGKAYSDAMAAALIGDMTTPLKRSTAKPKDYESMQYQYIQEEEARLERESALRDAQRMKDELSENAWQERGLEMDRWWEQSKLDIVIEYANRRADYQAMIQERMAQNLAATQQKELNQYKQHSAFIMDIAFAAAEDGFGGLARVLSGRLKAKAYEAAADSAQALYKATLAYARYDYKAGSEYLMAAGQAASFAALYGAGSVGLSSAGSSGGGGGEITSSRDFEDTRDTDEERDGGLTIIINGDYFQSRDGDEKAFEMIQRHMDRENPGRFKNEVD